MELHDLIGHRLMVIGLEARRLATGSVEPRNAAAAIDSLARTAASELRSVVQAHDPDGAADIRSLEEDLGSIVSVLPADVVALALGPEGLDDLSSPVRHMVRRTLQEGITNALRHGEGPVRASVQRVGSHVVLLLTNHLRVQGGPGWPGGNGSGLRSLGARVKALGGSTSVERTRSGEFRLRVTLPAGVAAARAGTERREAS